MQTKYAIPTLKRLCDRLLRESLTQKSPSPAICEVVDRAEVVFCQLEPDGFCSVTKVSRHLRGQAELDLSGTSFSGSDVRHDLRRLVEDLTRAHPRSVEDLSERVLSIEELAEQQEHARRRRSVDRLMRYLDDREQAIIARRFGLGYSHEPQTLQQMGDDLGVSKERIRQLQSRALGKLREAAEQAKIDLAEWN